MMPPSRGNRRKNIPRHCKAIGGLSNGGIVRQPIAAFCKLRNCTMRKPGLGLVDGGDVGNFRQLLFSKLKRLLLGEKKIARRPRRIKVHPGNRETHVVFRTGPKVNTTA